MKFSEVAKEDCLMMSQLVNMLQGGEFKVTGKDMCAGGDTIRWLQKQAVKLAEAYKAGDSPKSPPPAPAEEAAAPVPSPDEGLKVKAFSPGKMGKSK